MERYEDEKQLKTALENRLGVPISAKAFERVMKGRYGAYSTADFIEILAEYQRIAKPKNKTPLTIDEQIQAFLDTLSPSQKAKIKTQWAIVEETILFTEVLYSRPGFTWPWTDIPMIDMLLGFRCFYQTFANGHPNKKLMTDLDMGLVRFHLENKAPLPAKAWPVWNSTYPKWAFTSRRHYRVALNRAFIKLATPYVALWRNNPENKCFLFKLFPVSAYSTKLWESIPKI